MAGEDSTAAAAGYTMYLDQSAHLDWDWIQTFEQNFRFYPPQGATANGGVDQILTSAIAKLEADPAYYYTICEMGFLRRFVEEHPPAAGYAGAAAILKGFGDRFQALSGGITSADCLVCSGEGFIRNYLVGQSWLKRTLDIEARPHCWLPDDFGQGPELPALLSAMGFRSVAFMRIPGGQDGAYGTDFTKNGLDFVWTASDNSQVYAHWLTVWYNFGNKLEQNGVRQPAATGQFVAAYQSPGQPAGSYSGARTPFMYIPIDDDFSLPIDGLAEDISDWNSNQPDVAPGGEGPSGVGLVQGTFDQFMTNVITADQGAPTPPLMRRRYNGTPYWTGYFASRPALKILHHEAVRALVAAEVFGLLTQPGNGQLQNLLPTGFWDEIDRAWDEFAPSTHHDYVCGTATDPVYASEQLPKLRGAAERGRALRAAALNALAGMNGSSGSVLVANSLGFERTGLVEMDAVANPLWGGARQPAFEGGSLFFATVPSLGFATLSEGATPPRRASLDQQSGGIYVLSNQFLTAGFDASGNLLGIGDSATNLPVLGSPGGNILGFYSDEGGLYQFGSEPGAGGMTLDTTVSVTSSEVTVLETGPLRARLRVRSVFAGGNGAWSAEYVREYALVAGEPFLRMTTTGGAPSGYSVMARFPLAEPPATLDHGTGSHWTNVQPEALYAPPIFRATHDFLLPRSQQGELLGAVYHGGIPAWAIDGDGALIGCLLRNTPTNAMGAGGTDTGVHVQHYALRVPSGLSGAESGQPLREALGFSTPLQPALIPQAQPVMTGGSGSLASASGPAIVTAAKPGSYDPTSLVLRLYQPSNATATATVTLGCAPSGVALITATEQPLGTVQGVTGTGFALPMAGAIATVAVAGQGR